MTESHVTITDSRVLAAMSHPARRRILDLLHVRGPSTVSLLSAATGLAIGSVSHHLGVLSEARLVEEAPDLAKDRRERWWRPAMASRSWSSSDFEDSAAAAAVAAAAGSLNLEHQVGKVRSWQSDADASTPEWRGAAFSSDTWLRMTPDELREFAEELNELFGRWHRRALPADGATRDDVFVFAHGVPARP